jgi:hypothetical protein
MQREILLVRTFAKLLAGIGSVVALLAATSPAGSESGDSSPFAPLAPEYEELRPAVGWMLARAPRGWSKLRLSYSYFDRLARTRSYVMHTESQRWEELSVSDFAMMDFFDAYRAKSHRNSPKPWTAVTIVATRDTREFDVRFCYVTPQPRDVELDPDKMGC